MTAQELREKLMNAVKFNEGEIIVANKAIVEALIDIVCSQREALEFYAQNKHWKIDYPSGTFMSCDSHERDFSGKYALESLADTDQRLKEMGVL